MNQLSTIVIKDNKISGIGKRSSENVNVMF